MKMMMKMKMIFCGMGGYGVSMCTPPATLHPRFAGFLDLVNGALLEEGAEVVVHDNNNYQLQVNNESLLIMTSFYTFLRHESINTA